MMELIIFFLVIILIALVSNLIIEETEYDIHPIISGGNTAPAGEDSSRQIKPADWKKKLAIVYLFSICMNEKEQWQQFVEKYVMGLFLLNEINEKEKIINLVKDMLKNDAITASNKGDESKNLTPNEYISTNFYQSTGDNLEEKKLFLRLSQFINMGKNTFFFAGPAVEGYLRRVSELNNSSQRMIEIVDHIYNSTFVKTFGASFIKKNKDKILIYSLTHPLDNSISAGNLLDFNSKLMLKNGDFIYIGYIDIGVFRNIYYARILRTLERGKKITLMKADIFDKSLIATYVKYLIASRPNQIKSIEKIYPKEGKDIVEFNWSNNKSINPLSNIILNIVTNDLSRDLIPL